MTGREMMYSDTDTETVTTRIVFSLLSICSEP